MPPDHQPAEIEDRMWKGPRGSPENIGADLRAVHRCIRTNPVTGWKYVYAMGHHMQGIDRLADVESKMVKEHMERLVTDNQQLQVSSTSSITTIIHGTDSVFCSFESSGNQRILPSGTIEPSTT